MNMKPIEMQIALPRTHDAGSMQQQLQQKPIHDQSSQAQQTAKLTEEQLMRAGQVNSPDEQHVKLKDEQNNRQSGSFSGKREGKQKKRSKELEKAAHPYKGQHIDFTL